MTRGIKPEDRVPQNHRTIDRVTRILEEVVYSPGITFADLARTLEAPKSSVHGFISGLLAAGWLHEDDHRFYLGPAVYGLTLASGRIRVGLVTDDDIAALHRATGITVFLGVQAGDNLIYVSEVGTDTLVGYAARTNIRRSLLATAGGKALVAAMTPGQRSAYLRRRPEEEEHLVEEFLAQYDEITSTRIASNTLHSGARYALATTVLNQRDEVVAEVTLVGATTTIKPREAELSTILLEHVDRWRTRADETGRSA